MRGRSTVMDWGRQVRTGFFLLAFFVFSASIVSEDPPHHWNSPSEVVKKIKSKFQSLNSYKADFSLLTVEAKKSRTYSGVSYYKKPGKIRYDFSNPQGDAVVSDGQTLWIFIQKLGTVGKQDLELKKKNKSGQSIFSSVGSEGLSRLFRKYHYKFDSIEQPRKIDGNDSKTYFVLALEQREKIGGFEKMTLYVDSNSYFVKKAVAYDGRGKETTLNFTNITENPDLQDGMFKFSINGNSKIVNNPLVTEE